MFSQKISTRVLTQKITSIGIISICFSGCVTNNLETIEVSYTLPTLEKVSQKNASQKKGQVRITVEPFQYVGQNKPIIAIEENDFAKYGLSLKSGGEETYKIIETPRYISNPEFISFKVKIKNQMNHILKLEGTVITMKSNNSILAINKAGYKDFLNGVIPPQEEQVFTVYGPKTVIVKDGEKLTFSIFDVTTKTNKAGHAQIRESFRWTYNIKNRTETKQTQIKTYGKKLSSWQYEQLSKKSKSNNTQPL